MKKKIIKLFSSIFPGVFTTFAYNKLTQPQSHKLKQNDIVNMDSAIKSRLAFKNSEIQMYHWPNGDQPTVLLVHGWEGQAGNFSSIIKRLREENYAVLAFDGPSHGLSSKRTGTSLFEFAEVVGIIIEKFNIKNIVSHSFGGVATMYSLAQNTSLVIDYYVLLTTPNKFLDRIDTVAKDAGISNTVKKRLIKRLESELKMDLSTISVANLSQKVRVNKALIIHDQFDKVLSIKESQEVNENWANSSLESVEGTGHFKILKAEFVHDSLIRFLKD